MHQINVDLMRLASGPHSALLCAPKVLTPAYVIIDLMRLLCIRSHESSYVRSPPSTVLPLFALTGHTASVMSLHLVTPPRSQLVTVSMAKNDRTRRSAPTTASGHGHSPPILFLSPQQLRLASNLLTTKYRTCVHVC